jgi:hypothetical protein
VVDVEVDVDEVVLDGGMVVVLDVVVEVEVEEVEVEEVEVDVVLDVVVDEVDVVVVDVVVVMVVTSIVNIPSVRYQGVEPDPPAYPHTRRLIVLLELNCGTVKL